MGICHGYFSKNADVCIPQTPPPLESANVCNWVPPPPLKNADVLCGRPLTNFAQAFYYADFSFVKALTFPQFRKKLQTSWKYLEI